MLVTFSCPAYANITMFGNVAEQMLRMMGHSTRVPGALLAEDVEPALQRLRAAIAAEQQLPQPDADGTDDEPPVSLSTRALPLIELLAAAAKAEVNVMWDSGS